MRPIIRQDNPAAMTFEGDKPAGRKSISPFGPAAFAIALAIEAYLVVTANDRGWLALLSAAALVLTAVFGIVWLSSARASWRLNAILDAYASQEIGRGRMVAKGRGRSLRRAVHSHRSI